MNQFIDPLADTRPNAGITTKTPVSNKSYQNPGLKGRRPGFRLYSLILLGITFVGLIGILYFLFPGRTNILILGTDDRQPGEAVGRTDTMILTSLQPLPGKVGMLSIPRDLWVSVPNHGENRINTAHFFAEAEQPGTGLQAAKSVIELNFGIKVNYALRMRFDSFIDVVDALGGLEISLEQPTGGYEAGRHILNSEEALAFVRDRSGSDDFFRMERGQIFVSALIRAIISPQNLNRAPQIFPILLKAIETDLPMILWPRLGLTILRGVIFGIDARVITRDMITPFVTDGGAQVLAPRWDVINPVLFEVFGQ